jgi:hypothetical protein
MSRLDAALDRLGRRIAERIREAPPSPEDLSSLAAYADALRPGDVLLVDGGEAKVATAIRYLTQSSWSHAALFVGGPTPVAAHTPDVLIEAEVGLGVISSPLSRHAGRPLRICRPVGLAPAEVDALVGFARARIGAQYDLRNVIDLARWLFPTPPVPTRWRRRMIALGSGEPTRAICSTLIARAFQSIGYPILPIRDTETDPAGAAAREVYRVRHHSLFVPRDFDLSPYFEIVKPTLAAGFDHRAMAWASQTPADPT